MHPKFYYVDLPLPSSDNSLAERLMFNFTAIKLDVDIAVKGLSSMTDYAEVMYD